MTLMKSEKHPQILPPPARKGVLTLFTVIGLGAVTLAWVSSRSDRLNSMDQTAHEAPQMPPFQNTAGIHAGDPDTMSMTSQNPVYPPQNILPLEALRTKAGPLGHARELVRNLSRADLLASTRTPDAVAEWNRQLEELTELGTAAIPALQDFFRSRADVRLDSNPSALPSGETTLRREFIKVLFNIPDPENVELESQLLQTTHDPNEIALLAAQLKLQEPGTHREQILLAAKTALEREKGNPQGADTHPLLAIVEEYGDASVK